MTERKKLMNLICESVQTDRCITHCKHPHCNMVQMLCDHLIENGVTIPVRCKECKHTRKKNGHEQFIYNENVCICTKKDIWGITKNEPVWDDGFCSYGERKDNED